MPIVIGQKPAHDFNTPVGMLSDCHRRIEKFLGVLVTLAGETGSGVMTAEQRTALETALRYFRESGPRHTADEEESLFPRLRNLDAAEVRDSLAELDRLEADHGRADRLHAEADALAERWLADGNLSSADAGRLKQVTGELSAIYAAHIHTEESVVFPLAERLLSRESQLAMGQEMAARRSVKTGPRPAPGHGTL